jgi:hypothetical protein
MAGQMRLRRRHREALVRVGLIVVLSVAVGLAIGFAGR